MVHQLLVGGRTGHAEAVSIAHCYVNAVFWGEVHTADAFLAELRKDCFLLRVEGVEEDAAD